VQGDERKQLAIPKSETLAEPESNANVYATANGQREEDPGAAAATTAKLEAMLPERGTLRQELEQLRQQLECIQENHEREVVQLRQQLECIQESHAREVVQLKTDLEESEATKEHAGRRCWAGSRRSKRPWASG
jgi:chromosome segregation ATPase